MLARENRLLSADDFRVVLRRGRRIAAGSMVVSILATVDAQARFGFVVTKKVGNAVNRNRIRRRMKAIARELVDGGLAGVDVVVRAAPGVLDSEWTELRSQLRGALGRGPHE